MEYQNLFSGKNKEIFRLLGILPKVLSVKIMCIFQGGLRAVVWSDTFQTFVVMAGLIAVTVRGSIDLGGIDKVWEIADKGGRIFFLEYVCFCRTAFL